MNTKAVRRLFRDVYAADGLDGLNGLLDSALKPNMDDRQFVVQICLLYGEALRGTPDEIR